jgi:hypothetical protein
MSVKPRHRQVKLVLVSIDFTLNDTKTWMSANDFDQMMTALGLMTSRFNFLETEFKLALIKLLNCRNQDAAFAVLEERRGFENLLTLVQKLFAIYNSDTESVTRLAKIIATARTLNDRRNAYVHSMWYQPLDLQKPVARMKGPTLKSYRLL